MPVEGATSAQRNSADLCEHGGGTMNNGTLRLALAHATKGRHYDTVESDVVKAVVSSHAARHVGGIVKPLEKTLLIEIKCLVSGMGRNPRWEDHAELSPGLTILVVGLYFFDLNAGLSQQERDREVIPERVACEVEFLKFVPLRREDGTGEGVPGILNSLTTFPLASSIQTRLGVKCPAVLGFGNGVIVRSGCFVFNLITTPDSRSGRPLIRQRVPFNVTLACIFRTCFQRSRPPCAFIARSNRSFILISPVIAETCRRTGESRSLTVPAWPRPESHPSAR